MKILSATILSVSLIFTGIGCTSKTSNCNCDKCACCPGCNHNCCSKCPQGKCNCKDKCDCCPNCNGH